MLAQTLGAGKAQVKVASDLNVDKTDEQALDYGKDPVPLTQKKTTESLQGTGATAAGTSGTASNLPGYAANAAPRQRQQRLQEHDDRHHQRPRQDRHEDAKAPGAVTASTSRSSSTRTPSSPPRDLTALKQTLHDRGGRPAQAARRHLHAAAASPSPRPPAAAPTGGPIPAGCSGILKGIGLGLGALLFLFFITRHLRKRERGRWPTSRRGSRARAARLPALAMPGGHGRRRPADGGHAQHRQRRPPAPAAGLDHRVRAREGRGAPAPVDHRGRSVVTTAIVRSDGRS